MKITITIPDDKKQEIINAFCKIYKYQETIDDKPNPQSGKEFFQSVIQNFIGNVYKSHKSDFEEARKAAIEDAKTFTEDLTIT